MALEYGTPNMPEMVDGKTRLGGTYFNPLHKRIDQRVSVLEGLKASWEEATDILTAQGLNRIDAVLVPAFEEVESRLSALAELLATAEADLAAGAEGALAQIQPQIDAKLEAVDLAIGALETAVTDGSDAIATAVSEANAARDAANNAAASAFLIEDAASDADIREAEEGKVLTSDGIWEAADAVDLGNLTGTVALDFAGFLGLAYGVATGNITLGATSNVKPGQTVVFDITQDGTGGRTLAVNTSYWLTPEGAAPAWGTTANARNVLVGIVMGDGKVMLTLAGKKVS